MSDEKLQKQIDDAVEKATAALKAKNDELMTELKAERKAKKDAADKLAESEAEKLKAEEDAAAKSGDVDKVRKQLEDKHAKELEKARGESTALKGQLHNILIDDGLRKALVEAKVAPQLQSAAIALIKAENQIEVADADGKPIARIGGKAIAEFITGWSQGDGGKAFVAAPGNGGGGAGGADGGGGAKTGKTMNRADFDKLDATDRMSFTKEGGKITDAA